MPLLLVLAMAADGYACTPAALRETIAAPDGTEIPLYSSTDYAFIAEIIGNTSEPKSTPSVKVRVIESWTGRAKAGENLRVVFVEMVCWDEVAPDVSIDVGAYAAGTRVRVVSESLQISAYNIGLEFVVIGVGP
jgi:hypothetical protein